LRNEHGIYTLIPFIKYYFPETEVVPLILNPRQTNSEFFDFGQKVQQEFAPASTLLIVSSDFSHNLSLEKSQEADLQSIEILNKLSLENLEMVNCDCQACLAFLLGYLANENYQFELVDNKSSAEFSEESLETVTSYVSGYFLP
jgi:AmmeMemoRadiSam system protein B